MSSGNEMPQGSNDYDLKVGKNVFMKEPIAIIGLGCVLPGGIGVGNFWKFLLKKGYAVREVSRDRWDPEIYYSSDRSTPDKTYCKIGAFVEGFEFDATKFRIPPNVAQRIDLMQKWALVAAQEALEDAGYGANKDFDRNRVAVIMANAMGGEIRDDTILRVQFLQIADIIKK